MRRWKGSSTSSSPSLQVVEDLSLEGEEAAVDPEIGLADVADVAHEAVVVRATRRESVWLGRTQTKLAILSWWRN